jgi:hypothetical protein
VAIIKMVTIVPVGLLQPSLAIITVAAGDGDG